MNEKKEGAQEFSSEEDENGKTKLSHLPFKPKVPVTFDFKGKLIEIQQPRLYQPKIVRDIINNIKVAEDPVDDPIIKIEQTNQPKL